MGKYRLACHLIQFRGEQNENPEVPSRRRAEWGGDEPSSRLKTQVIRRTAQATYATNHGL